MQRRSASFNNLEKRGHIGNTVESDMGREVQMPQLHSNVESFRDLAVRTAATPSRNFGDQAAASQHEISKLLFVRVVSRARSDIIRERNTRLRCAADFTSHQSAPM